MRETYEPPAGRAIGWRVDLLLGGLAAMLVGSTIVLCLYAWLLADEELLLPAVHEADLVGAQDDICDVVAVECAALGIRLSLALSTVGLADATMQLVLPVPSTNLPCSDAASASAILRDTYSLELGATSRCVLSTDGAESLAVQIEVAQPVGTLSILKFAVACAATCTPCCIAVGLALAVAAHPEAHALAVMVEQKTRQSGLLPRCDFDARTLANTRREESTSPIGKMV